MQKLLHGQHVSRLFNAIGDAALMFGREPGDFAWQNFTSLCDETR